MLRSNEIIRAAALNASSKVGVGVYEDGGVENSNTANTNVAAGSAAISNSLDLFASYIQAKETSVSAREKNLRSNSSYSRSAELNSYYRSKLRRSLTYLITQGCFQTVRSLIQSKTVDLNETDQWWLLNPNVELVNKKCLLVRRDRYRILSRLQSSIDCLNRFGSPQLGIALGRTPLMLCSMIQDDSWAFSIAQMLFENGAQLDMKDTLGYSALMYACLYERARIMELFLNASGTEFDIFDKDNYGNTVFHLASMHPSENMCCICDTIATKFNFKKESLKLRNYFRHTPMDLCFLNGHQTCIKRYYESLESPKSPTRIFENSQGPKLSSRSASTFLLSPSILLNSNSTSNNNKKQSIKDNTTISSSSNETQFKNNQLKQLDVLNIIDKKRVLETYKIVLCLREPLIKVNDKRKKKKQQSLITTSAPTRNEYIKSGKTKSPIIITRFQRLSIFKPYDQLNAASNSSTTTMPIIRQPQRRGTFEMRRQDEDTMLASSLNLTNLTKTNASGGDFGSFEWSTISWRNNVEKLFETVEFQRTKSYRTPSSGSTNNLFEQLLNSSTNGAIVVDAATAASQQQAAAGADRKGSMAKAKLTIAQNNKDSSNSLQPTTKTSGSTNKSITGGSQKRASVISLKNI